MAVDPMFTDITAIVTQILIIGGFIFGAVKHISAQNEKRTERINQTITDKVKTVDDKILTIISDLKRRADFTNGNVVNIRNDIMDLQEEIEVIQDAHGDPSPARRRKRDRKRQIKRSMIQSDKMREEL